MIVSRRSFISEIVLGLSATIFTPVLVSPKWKDTLGSYRAVPKFVPHWAILRTEWLDERRRCWLREFEHLEVENFVSRTGTVFVEEYVRIEHPWYDQVYEEVKTPSGIIVHPLTHFPPDFNPS